RAGSGSTLLPVRVEVATASPHTLSRGGDFSAEILHLENGLVIENAERPGEITQLIVDGPNTVSDLAERLASLKKRPVELTLSVVEPPTLDALDRFIDNIATLSRDIKNIRCSLRGPTL